MATLCAFAVPGAIAQKSATDAKLVTPEPLQITLVRSKVILAGAKEVMQSAAIAQPGETLEEVATYTNTSKAALKNLEATLPIPPNTELVVASIKPANAKASIDGKNFSKVPLSRKVKLPSGVEIEQPVPLSEYRYLRWYPGELRPDRPLIFSARFKVANTPVIINDVGK
jgi:uncharacterized repeat protein (TIGR01451 family)